MKLKHVIWITLAFFAVAPEALAQNQSEYLGGPIRNCRPTNSSSNTSSKHAAFCPPFDLEESVEVAPEDTFSRSTVLDSTVDPELSNIANQLFYILKQIFEICAERNSGICSTLFQESPNHPIYSDRYYKGLSANNPEAAVLKFIQEINREFGSLDPEMEVLNEVLNGMKREDFLKKELKYYVEFYKHHLDDIKNEIIELENTEAYANSANQPKDDFPVSSITDKANQPLDQSINQEQESQPPTTGNSQVQENIAADKDSASSQVSQKESPFYKNKNLEEIERTLKDIEKHLEVDKNSSILETVGAAIASTGVNVAKTAIDSTQLGLGTIDLTSDAIGTAMAAILEPMGLIQDGTSNHLRSDLTDKLDMVTTSSKAFVASASEVLPQIPDMASQAASNMKETTIGAVQGNPRDIKKVLETIGNIAVTVFTAKAFQQSSKLLKSLSLKTRSRLNKASGRNSFGKISEEDIDKLVNSISNGKAEAGTRFRGPAPGVKNGEIIPDADLDNQLEMRFDVSKGDYLELGGDSGKVRKVMGKPDSIAWHVNMKIHDLDGSGLESVTSRKPAEIRHHGPNPKAKGHYSEDNPITRVNKNNRALTVDEETGEYVYKTNSSMSESEQRSSHFK